MLPGRERQRGSSNVTFSSVELAGPVVLVHFHLATLPHVYHSEHTCFASNWSHSHRPIFIFKNILKITVDNKKILTNVAR